MDTAAMTVERLAEIKLANAQTNVFTRPSYVDELIAAVKHLHDFQQAVMKGQYTVVYDDTCEEWAWEGRDGMETETHKETA